MTGRSRVSKDRAATVRAGRVWLFVVAAAACAAAQAGAGTTAAAQASGARATVPWPHRDANRPGIQLFACDAHARLADSPSEEYTPPDPIPYSRMLPPPDDSNGTPGADPPLQFIDDAPGQGRKFGYAIGY